MIYQILTGLLLVQGTFAVSTCPGLLQQLQRMESNFSATLASAMTPLLAKLNELDAKIQNRGECGYGPPTRVGGNYAASNSTSSMSSPLSVNAMNKGVLRFNVAGKNFPDLDTTLSLSDTTDAYFELFVSTDMGTSKIKLLRSDVIQNTENPIWGNTFDFAFDRLKNQWLLFYVYDKDAMSEDETVGRVWVNVADYVDKGQQTIAKLDKSTGYLLITANPPQPNPTPGVPVGSLPLPFGAPTSKMLQFRVSANGIATKDDIGFIPGSSDPYVMVFVKDGVNGTERDVGRSSTVTNTRNPTWSDVFRVQWDARKGMWLKLKIYDHDNLREDDKLGKVWIELNDYVAHGETYTVILPKKGTLTITKA